MARRKTGEVREFGGRPKTSVADFISWPTRFPPDMLTRLKAIAEMEHRPINWQIVLFMEDALEAYDARAEADAEAEKPRLRSAASV